MKQSDATKMVNQAIKVVGKKFDWKCKEGCLFKKNGSLFFVFSAFGQAKKNEIDYTLQYKLYDFDEIFWNIVDLKENAKQPLSFHYFGAWTAPTMCVKKEKYAINEWNESFLIEKYSTIFQDVNYLATQIAQEITTVDENLKYLEALYSELLRRYPGAVVNIYKEKLMTAILKKENSLALEIAEDRIAHNDSGGFLTGSVTFYQQAKEYIKRCNKDERTE